MLVKSVSEVLSSTRDAAKVTTAAAGARGVQTNSPRTQCLSRLVAPCSSAHGSAEVKAVQLAFVLARLATVVKTTPTLMLLVENLNADRHIQLAAPGQARRRSQYRVLLCWTSAGMRSFCVLRWGRVGKCVLRDAPRRVLTAGFLESCVTPTEMRSGTVGHSCVADS